MICPYCRETLEDDSDFCEFCGRELVAAAEKPVGTPAAEPPADPPVSAAVPGGKFDLEAAAGALLRDAKERKNASVEPAPESGCPHLSVEYAVNRFLLEGTEMPLELRIRVDSKKLESLLLWFAPSAGGKTELVPVSTEELRFGRAVPIAVPYHPAVGGVLDANFYFGCVLGDGVEFYRMNVRPMVFTREQSSASIVATISNSERAMLDLSELREFANSNPGAATLIRKANDEPAKFRAMALAETVWRPEQHFVPGRTYRCDALTLEYKGCRYQLCGKETVKLGRKPELNDFAILDWVNARNDREYPNNTVSRNHVQIHFCGDAVNIIDTSSYGTFVNGVKPEIAGNAGIPLPDEAELRFGDIELHMEMQRCEQRPESSACKNCRAGKIKSLTLTRADRLPEVYALVWQCCELGYLSRELEGFAVYRRNGGFLLRTPDGTFRHLVPNTRIDCRGTAVEVKSFRQFEFQP